MPKVSVIVPVYGVEQYIKRCAESLMQQSLLDVEFIFVDDATPDDSISFLQDVLAHYPYRSGQVKIVHHSRNLGLPTARNTGMAVARGEYIVHIDGDDFAEPEMLETLYNAVSENSADMAWCDYYVAFSDTERRRVVKQPDFGTPLDAVKGMLRGSMKYNVWNKICRRKLYVDNDITFPDGNPMGEDLTMVMVALHARKCISVKKPLYNYLQNPGQMTALLNEGKLYSLTFNCERVCNYISLKFPCLGLESENAALCQLMKWPFLLDGKYESYKTWCRLYPASNNQIWKTQGVNRRIKLVEWCAAKHLFLIVWLHYIVIIKFYYGLVYGRR